jgi:hypothetical protein
MSDGTKTSPTFLDMLARRHGFSAGAAEEAYRALRSGKGRQAQFNHPELGGMGQWAGDGMVMIGDMFNGALKIRVDALLSDLSARMRDMPAEDRPEAVLPERSGRSWWPEGLGTPATSGAQDGQRYAWFPEARRLAIETAGAVTLYDTGEHRIGGVSQSQSGHGPGQLRFSSQHGELRLSELPLADEGAGGASPPEPAAGREAAPAGTPEAGTGEPLSSLERLGRLYRQGLLTEEEFRDSKASLLRRL